MTIYLSIGMLQWILGEVCYNSTAAICKEKANTAKNIVNAGVICGMLIYVMFWPVILGMVVTSTFMEIISKGGK